MATIRSLQHPAVKRLYKLRRQRSAREEAGLCVVYSQTLLEEIGRKGVIRELWVPEGVGVCKKLQALKLVPTTEEVVRKVMGLTSASDMMGVVDLPKEQKRLTGDRLLLLDRLQDPGNVGTLIRSALALSWDGVYLVDGCVDPFNDKALRASRGALFYFPYQAGPCENVLEHYPNHRLICADPKGKSVHQMAVSPPLLLALGNEAQGLSERLLKRSERVAIPMDPAMESLNVAVAGGILLYALGEHGN